MDAGLIGAASYTFGSISIYTLPGVIVGTAGLYSNRMFKNLYYSKDFAI